MPVPGDRHEPIRAEQHCDWREVRPEAGPESKGISPSREAVSCADRDRIGWAEKREREQLETMSGRWGDVLAKEQRSACMAELSIDPDYVRRLIVKVRAFMAKEATEIPDDGSNATDDALHPALQDEPGDLSREEVVEEIRGLEPRQ